jgi:hypothetical protein
MEAAIPLENCADRGNALIRQAISCDICGTEKKQTNHWFVAYDQGGELRVSGWNTRNRLRPGSKHLCGQTCLHKLVDEFMARSLQARPPAAANDVEVEQARVKIDASLTSSPAYAEVDSSARLITPISPALPMRPALRPPVELVSMPPRPPYRQPVDDPLPSPNEPPVFMSRQWRAEAWERERERETRAAEHRSEIALRRRSN